MQPSVLTTLAYATGLTIRRRPADRTRAESAAQPLVLAASAVALTSFGLATSRCCASGTTTRSSRTATP